MNNQQRAEKQAARDSKTMGARYVVYVFDEGYQVFSREQVRRYGPLVNLETLWVDGVKVADSAIAAQLAAI